MVPRPESVWRVPLASCLLLMSAGSGGAAVKMTNGREPPPGPPPLLPPPYNVSDNNKHIHCVFSSPLSLSLHSEIYVNEGGGEAGDKAVTLRDSSPRGAALIHRRAGRERTSTRDALNKDIQRKKKEKSLWKREREKERERQSWQCRIFLPVLGNLSSRLATCNRGGKRVDARTFSRL